MQNEKPLTADGLGLLELLVHLLVHLDGLILLLDEVLMPVVAPVLHPIGEPALQDCRADINEPLLRHLGQLDLPLGQVVVHVRIRVVEELEDVLVGQAFVSIRKQ